MQRPRPTAPWYQRHPDLEALAIFCVAMIALSLVAGLFVGFCSSL